MRRYFIMLISILVLFSTTGLPRVQHLCGGIVQSAGIWIGASGCDHEIVSSNSCTAHSSTKHEQKATPSSCCTKQSPEETSEEKNCCTDQVDWEPSQVDLAIGDEVLPEGQISFIFPIASYIALFPVNAEDPSPYVRPPPLRPYPQSRRRALLQVYRC